MQFDDRCSRDRPARRRVEVLLHEGIGIQNKKRVMTATHVLLMVQAEGRQRVASPSCTVAMLQVGLCMRGGSQS